MLCAKTLEKFRAKATGFVPVKVASEAGKKRSLEPDKAVRAKLQTAVGILSKGVPYPQ
jgi:hypothetical protein